VDALMRTRVAMATTCFALALAMHAQAQAPVSTEADLIRSLRARAPVEALRAAAEARAELAGTARVTATTTSIVAHHESVSGDAEGSASVVGAGLSFDLSRANALAREAAGLDATAARAATDELLLDAACEVRSLAGDIDSLERRIRTLEEERARITLLRVDAEQRAEAGEEAPFEADVLRAEESARDLQVPALRAAISAARAALEAITGVSTAGFRLDEATEVAPEGLASTVLQQHPRLRTLRARAEAGRARRQVARASNGARLDVFGGARTEHEPGASGDGYEVEVGVTLPARSLRRAAVSEAIVSERELDVELALAERSVERRLATALAAWRSLDEAVRDRAAATPSLVEGALRRFRAGEGSLAEVIQILALDRDRLLSDIELQSARRSARIDLDCASALVTAPALLRVLEENRP
jgi:outer membrane protein TolC